VENALAYFADHAQELAPLLLASCVVLLLLSLILAVCFWRIFNGLKVYRSIMDHLGNEDAADNLAELLNKVTLLEQRVGQGEQTLQNQNRMLQSHGEHLTKVVQQVNLVRYNAFPDVAGDQSYSLAFLNNLGDGVVITTLHGRTEARTYAKAVQRGSSVYPLLPEEKQAIAQALGGSRVEPSAEEREAPLPEVGGQDRAYLLGRVQEMQSYQQLRKSTPTPTPTPTGEVTPLGGAGEYTRVISSAPPNPVGRLPERVPRTSLSGRARSGVAPREEAAGEPVANSSGDQVSKDTAVFEVAKAVTAPEPETEVSIAVAEPIPATPPATLPELEALAEKLPANAEIPVADPAKESSEEEELWSKDKDTPPPWVATEGAGIKKVRPF